MSLLFGRDVRIVVGHERDPSVISNKFDDGDAERERSNVMEEWVSTYGQGHKLGVTCNLFDFSPANVAVVHTKGLPMLSECMVAEE